MGALYATQEQAIAQACAFRSFARSLDCFPARLAWFCAMCLESPGTCSDALLLIADGLRMDAFELPAADGVLKADMRQVAAYLADLAPTRANPLEPAP